MFSLCTLIFRNMLVVCSRFSRISVRGCNFVAADPRNATGWIRPWSLNAGRKDRSSDRKSTRFDLATTSPLQIQRLMRAPSFANGFTGCCCHWRWIDCRARIVDHSTQSSCNSNDARIDTHLVIDEHSCLLRSHFAFMALYLNCNSFYRGRMKFHQT